MKLNRKGFTLIELLAVVVILLAISVMAISSISSAIERNKNKQNETKQRMIVSYAELYYQEHKNSYSSIDNFCVTVNELINYKYLTVEEAEDVDGRRIEGAVKYYLDEKTNMKTYIFEEYDEENNKGTC